MLALVMRQTLHMHNKRIAQNNTVIKAEILSIYLA